MYKRKKKGFPLKSKPLKTFDYPFSSHLFKIAEGLAKGCNGKHPKKFNRVVDESIPISTIKWVEHEFFYSFIDSIYFSHNEFYKILENSNLIKLGKLSRHEWNFLRLTLGKPRRFSRAFISNEIDKMNEFRNLVRGFLTENIDFGYLETKIRNKDLLEKVLRLSPLNVGQIVLGFFIDNDFSN